ncbi:MAG: GyrI-like domain-containing protein [Erysipelotrichaceae bacterium]|nr:GyrI-like domain-containing protein [Erysipelotrichaceae bacterium]
MKTEWRKTEKNIYLPKKVPELICIPRFKYFMISGIGNPNTEAFAQRIEVLYALAYAIKMMPKKGVAIAGYFDYTVYPLEGVWDLTEKGKSSEQLNKDELIYTLMIRQPDFVDASIAQKAIAIVKQKNKSTLVNDVVFDEIEEGLVVQMMHIGSFDDEPRSFEQMKKFIAINNLVLNTLKHKEIYLSDFRKTKPDDLKTVLRYSVSKQ